MVSEKILKKFTTDDGQDDGNQVIAIDHMSIWVRCAKKKSFSLVN